MWRYIALFVVFSIVPFPLSLSFASPCTAIMCLNRTLNQVMLGYEVTALYATFWSRSQWSVKVQPQKT